MKITKILGIMSEAVIPAFLLGIPINLIVEANRPWKEGEGVYIYAPATFWILIIAWKIVSNIRHRK